MSITLVGLNYRTAPLALREQFALTGEQIAQALADLRCTGCPVETEREIVILSTCNRLEFYVASGSNGDENTTGQLRAYLAALGNLPLDALRPHLYTKHNGDAITHLMRVASGLDSQILGEAQVIGQVAAAAEDAHAAGTLGTTLARLFAHAVHTGKRARSETEISRHTTSVSHTAARLASEQMGDQARVLIVGAGDMAQLAALALDGQPITVVNRTYERAAALAREVRGRALDWLQLRPALAWADVVIVATRAPQPVIAAADVSERERPLLLIDLSVPRNIDPAARDLPNVTAYALDDLQSLVDSHLAQRQAAVPAVEAIIAAEAALFKEWLNSREVVPVIADLQRWARTVAEAEITQALNRLDQNDPHTEEVIARLAHRLVGKLLHEPTVRLKLHAAGGNGADYASTVRDLFGLDSEDPLAASEVREHA